MILNGDGIITKTESAKEKYTEEAAREKLQVIIMQLRTNIVSNQKRGATLEDLQDLTNSETQNYNEQISQIVNHPQNTNKLVLIDGYMFEVDEKLNISETSIDIGIFAEIEMSYTIASTSESNNNINVTVVSDMEIDKVILPNGSEKKPEDDNKKVTFNYDVVAGNEYVFKILIVGSEKLLEYKVKMDESNTPKITQLDSSAYPILTQNGVVAGKRIQITYGTNTNNYYSLDNGNTWKEYSETIIVNSNCTVMAKSINENMGSQVVQSNVTISLASDAVPAAVYNGSTSDYYHMKNGVTKKILVDPSMWGKNMYLSAKENAVPDQGTAYKCYVYAHLNDGTTNTLYQTVSHNAGYTRKAIAIPQNTSYITFYTGTYGTIYWRLGEIQSK